MAVYRYGIKMTGLKKAASETKRLSKYSCGHVQIDYNATTGEILSYYFKDINSFIKYKDTTIMRIGNTYMPMSMQQIADMVMVTLFIEQKTTNRMERSKNYAKIGSINSGAEKIP